MPSLCKKYDKARISVYRISSYCTCIHVIQKKKQLEAYCLMGLLYKM